MNKHVKEIERQICEAFGVKPELINNYDSNNAITSQMQYNQFMKSNCLVGIDLANGKDITIYNHRSDRQ